MRDLEAVSLEPAYTETVTAERFLEIYHHEKENLETARPVPAPLGSNALGRILVVRKRPVYAATLEQTE